MDDLPIQWVYHGNMKSSCNRSEYLSYTNEEVPFFTNDGFKPIYVKTQKTRGSDQVTEVSNIKI